MGRLSPGSHNWLAGIFFASLSLAGLFEPARAAISVSNENPKQGQTVEVSLPRKEQIDSAVSAADLPTLQFNERSYQLFPAKESNGVQSCQWRVLLSIPADLPPGTYVFSTGDGKKQINVVDGNFPLQKIRLPKGKDTFEASPGEEEAVDRAKELLSPERLWRKHFDLPSAARISAGFGIKRVVNGKLLPDYTHSGVDFAAQLGSPVRTCAPGVVVLIGRNWKLHGNLIAIDHGQGVVSFYIHLSKILVKKGDEVKSGQMIGQVGHSGRANGPHLHFSLYVNQVATNPCDWFKQLF